MKTTLSLVALAAALSWVRRRLVRVEVTGQSMHPTLGHGDVVLIRRTTGRGLRPGRIAVAQTLSNTNVWDELTGILRPPHGQSWMIKRIAAVNPHGGPAQGDRDLLPTLPPGTVFLLGDNPDASSDSRHLGPWPVDRLLGVVVCRLRRDVEPQRDFTQRAAGPGRTGRHA